MNEQVAVSLMTFLISVPGLFVNGLVLFAIWKMESMNSSFGIITRNMVVCNIIMCFIFLVYICPMQLLDAPILVSHSHFIGTFAMIVYDVSNQSHLLIAFNRFCAVFLSTYYSSVFSKNGTKYMLLSTWLFSLAICLVCYELIACHFSYDDVSFTLGFASIRNCVMITWYSDFILNTFLVILTLLINLITAYKAGKNSRLLISATGMTMSKEQRRREMSFIKQCFAQGLTIFTGQVTYHLVAPVLTNAILLCFVASLWAFMHAVEGVVILTSNREILKFVVRRGLKRQTISVVAKSTSK